MFCPKCGTFNDETGSKCIKCEFQLKMEENIVDAESEQDKTKKNVTEDAEEKVLPEEEKPLKRAEPSAHFLWAILSAVFCSVAFGAAAVVFAGMTQTEKSVGDREKAYIYSQKAKLFCVISLAMGIVKALTVVGIIALVYFRII